MERHIKPMANTYSKLYFHVVFAVNGRRNHVSPKWKDDLYKYITGVVTNKDQKLMIINGVPNHIHILLGTKPNCNLSDLVRDIKANSSRWINEKGLIDGKFEWQSGFGAFTVSQTHKDVVINYIKNQKEHHRIKTFKEEYIEILRSYEIEYQNEYLFDDE